MQLNIGLNDKQRKGSVGVLSQVLADEYVLYTQARNNHWNVIGPDFGELHKFFEAQYEEVDEIIDEVAERIRALGESTPATLKTFLATTELKEPVGKPANARKMLADLLASHETLIRSLRKGLTACDEQFGDMGTSDFLTGLMEQHEKMAWMVRSYLS